MKHAVEMGSVAVMYTPIFIETVSGIQKLLGGIHRHTDSKAIAKPYFFFQNTESRLKLST
jgi:hypothetical protein